MGLSSKRRGGSGGNGEASEGPSPMSGSKPSKVGPGGRAKEKHSRPSSVISDHKDDTAAATDFNLGLISTAASERTPEKSSTKHQDGIPEHEGKPSLGGSGRGGPRIRLLARASASTPARSPTLPRSSNAPTGRSAATSPKSANHLVENQPSNNKRRKALDPTLLARGMSARSIGARISSHVHPLTSDEIERDLRHMEAYRVACTAYAQQFFAYINRDLVNKGVYGHVSLALPSVAAAGSEHYYGNVHESTFLQSEADRDSMIPMNDPTMPGIQGPSVSSHTGVTIMPARIDPEEEKRLAILRKRVAASEAKREVLETEYLSLRAHYVNESYFLRRTRHSVTGQVKFLQELVRRRGETLGLRRARCAVARDILQCLEYRAKQQHQHLGSATEEMKVADDNGNGSGDMEGVEYETTTTDGSKNSANVDELSSLCVDPLEAWLWIESQLQAAELACLSVETPKEILSVKASLLASSHGDDKHAERHSTSVLYSDRRSNSPPSRGAKSSSKDDDSSVANGGNAPSSKKKAKVGLGGKDTRNGAGEVLGKVQASNKKGFGSSDDGSLSNGNGSLLNERDGESERKIKEYSTVDCNNDKFNQRKLSPADEDDNVIPWNCQTMPRTPFGVPILISDLSTAPDKSAAFGCGDVFGNESSALSWFESNLPTSCHPEMEEESKELSQLREEAKFLIQELEQEAVNNNNLQKQITVSRKQSDEMCAMMSMLRTETEAVLNRHNIILETPEARSRANELLAKGRSNNSQHNEEEEAEEDEDELDNGEEENDIEDDEPEDGDEPGVESGGSRVEIITADDDVSQDDDDDDDADNDHHLTNVTNDNGAELSSSAVTPADESDSAEEGEIQEDYDENDGDDENENVDYDEEEEGESSTKAVAGRQQPIVEVIVRRTSSSDDDDLQQQGKSDTITKAGGSVEDEEEGEIREYRVSSEGNEEDGEILEAQQQAEDTNNKNQNEDDIWTYRMFLDKRKKLGLTR